MDPFLLNILYIIGFEVVVLLLLAIFMMVDAVRVVHRFRRVSERALQTADEITTAVRDVKAKVVSLINTAYGFVESSGRWFGKKKKKRSKSRKSSSERSSEDSGASEDPGVQRQSGRKEAG